jgi:hypothetical protein
MMAALIGVHGAGNSPENKECWSWLAALDHQVCGRALSSRILDPLGKLGDVVAGCDALAGDLADQLAKAGRSGIAEMHSS